MILRPTNSPDDWKDFLAKPELHWKPGHSAMEAAYSWERARGLPVEIAALFPDADLLLAVPEWKVPLPGGVRDSQNDVFALLSDAIGLIPVMVEAKRDEPFGPTLGEWLKASSPGKTERLEAICKLLGLDSIKLDPNLRYQLFHRTASAVLTADRFHARRAAMVVQSFSPDHRWFGDYVAFAECFGLRPTRNCLAETRLPGGLRLSLGWVSCPISTDGIAL